MTDREKEFENLVNDIRFDDTPDYNHREKLEQDLMALMAELGISAGSPCCLKQAKSA